MGWGDKFNQITKSAVSKSKEMAEITRLNMEISNHEQKIRELAAQIGMSVVEQHLLVEDAQISEWTAQIEALQAAINKNREVIRDIRNINICPNCGAEVPRTGNFCNKCGSPIDRSVLEDSIASSVPTCSNCGAPLEPDSMFCTNCGAKRSS